MVEDTGFLFVVSFDCSYELTLISASPVRFEDGGKKYMWNRDQDNRLSVRLFFLVFYNLLLII